MALGLPCLQDRPLNGHAPVGDVCPGRDRRLHALRSARALHGHRRHAGQGLGQGASAMTTYTITGKPFEFDETQKYLDFFLEDGQRHLVTVIFGPMLEALQDGRTLTFADVEMEMIMLDRWRHEAPR